MTKLNDLFTTSETLKELVDISDEFDLADIHKAIGDESLRFIVQMSALMDDMESRITLYSILDKLLNTDKNSLISYSDSNPTVRTESKRAREEETLSFIVDERSSLPLTYFKETHPNLIQYPIVLELVVAMSLLDITTQSEEGSILLDSAVPENIMQVMNLLNLVDGDISVADIVDSLEDIEINFEHFPNFVEFLDKTKEEGHDIEDIEDFLDILDRNVQ